MKNTAVLAAIVLASFALNGCGRSAPWTRTASPVDTPAADADDSGYREPPQVKGAQREPGGAVVLTGQALPGATVRLASPDGRAEQTTADASGAWSLTAPRGGAAIYGLSQEVGGRRQQAQGYLAVLPHGEPAAAVLRSGAGAVALARGSARPAITAIDFDGTGAAVVSGWAGSSQPLKVLVDGTSVDEGTSGPDGRFFLSLPKPLGAGMRSVQVVSPTGATRVGADVSPPPVFTGVMHAVPRGAGWRIDWSTPTGGIQSTELFALTGTGR
ncbi:MAG TPA: hypothetical protein VG960_11265 [Caulobacteraceae bacterium]|nr:hypothetical protein [Caulobacteraceae bacterium]